MPPDPIAAIRVLGDSIFHVHAKDVALDRQNVAVNGVWVCRHGAAGDERGKVDLTPKDVTITIDLSAGPQSAAILTTDLTAAYVHENSAYST